MEKEMVKELITIPMVINMLVIGLIVIEKDMASCIMPMEENIREVVAFPMNSNAQDLLLGAPNEVSEQQLREVHVKLR